MNERWNCETENRDLNTERRAVDIDHLIMTLHGSQRRFNHCAAGILIFTAGGNMRLLADHPFTLNFSLTTVAVSDEPVAAKQLNLTPPQIANGDGISEDVALLFRRRLRFDIDALHLDANTRRINHG